MKTKKKNRFLTFCFSLMPGAAEMYMGFMRTGTELMLFFLGMIMIPSFLGLEGLSILAVVIWAYGFFHANHLASLSDEEFAQVEDNDIFGMGAVPKRKKEAAGKFQGICSTADRAWRMASVGNRCRYALGLQGTAGIYL